MRTPPLIVLTAVAVAAAGVPQSVEPDPAKILFLDPRVVAQTDGPELRMGKVEKHPANPLIRADKPWDRYQGSLFPNIVYDESDGLYKVWYMSVLAEDEQIERMMPPSRVVKAGNKGFYVSYAQSKDGIHWTKPLLGIVGYDRQDTNVVLQDVMNMGVYLDPRAPDRSRRFKMIHGGARIDVQVRFSPDGIRWSDGVPALGLEVGNGYIADTHNNVFWEETLGRYVLFTRWSGPHGRSVAISTSADFVSWERPRLVLESLPSEGKKRQIYSMPVFRYANGYLGLLAMFNAGGDQGTNCELAWSPDRVTWHRILPGTPFIPHGEKSDFDGTLIYTQANPPLVQDGRVRIYYGGGTGPKPRDWKGVCQTGLALLRPDGFAGYTVLDGRETGTLTTNPLRLIGGAIQITADIGERGSLRVEALDAAGNVVARSKAIGQSGTDVAVSWEPGAALSDRAGARLRFRFQLSQATLYAMRGVEVIP